MRHAILLVGLRRRQLVVALELDPDPRARRDGTGVVSGRHLVFDWTDAAKPQEIAFFDRGPVDSLRQAGGGSWSAYWYNGAIVSSEIARGLDVAELIPTQYISQNEIDAAKTVRLEYLNTQGQPKLVWPPSFALAKAYVDQLERNKCLSASRIAAVRQEITSAERATGPARHDTLAKLASGLEGDARSSCDARRCRSCLRR